MNTYMFNPSKDKYYAIMLMRTEAKKFTLANYYYQLFRLLLGMALFSLLAYFFIIEMTLWISLMLPFFVLFVKASWTAVELKKFQKTGTVANENQLGWIRWSSSIAVIAWTYLSLWLGFSLNDKSFLGIFLLFAVVGSYSLWKIHHFKNYTKMQKTLLTTETVYMTSKENINKATQENMAKKIEYNKKTTSDKEGFAYFHDLFVKRHRKLLLRAVERQAIVVFILLIVAIVLTQLQASFNPKMNELLLQYFPYMVFISYIMNRGMTLTQAMYMNCDHSMLTYQIYRTPAVILGVFKERLKTLVSLNLIPATVLAIGFPVLLWLTGGTTNEMNYVILFVSVLALSIFFSVHYLVMYYLLQPYNNNVEMKSASYSIVQGLTYFVSYFLIGRTFSTLSFGLATVLFSIIYIFLSLLIVYKLAPKTFKIRT
ncbi:hypothetical protein [Tetragenococcus halophilus]|uniref:hypothetical protein n=1 Tax=Tetragenococcus halophilus TaxID=51669 RepID=UPI0030C99C77